MINLLKNGKVVINIEDNYYEFISITKLAKNGGIISRFQLYNISDNFDDEVSYRLEDKFVYYDNDMDTILVWTNKDEDNNISDKIIWYKWNNNELELLTDTVYNNIVEKYNNNNLKLLNEIYKLYNKDTVEDIESSTTDDGDEDDEDDSDFITDDDDIDDDDDDIDIDEDTMPLEERIDNTQITNYINYMAKNVIEFRREYVNNLIYVANSTTDIDIERLNIVLDHLHNYYLI